MDKLKLLEITAQKLATDKHFLCYYLTQSQILHGRSQADMVSLLHCSTEEYYKLALCQFPDPGHSDYTGRLFKIAAYSNVSFQVLDTLIKELKPAQKPDFMPALLHQFLSSIRIPGTLYRAGFSVFSLLFLALTLTAKVELNDTRFFTKSYSVYKDSVKSLCLPDNTGVSDPIF